MMEASPYFVHKALYERALGLRDVLAQPNSGFRIFCTEDRFARVLFDPSREWSHYGPIYLTGPAATAVRALTPSPYHFDPLSEDLHVLLDNCWHVIGQFTRKSCWFGVEDLDKLARVVSTRISDMPKINLIVGKLDSADPLAATVSRLDNELVHHLTDLAEAAPPTVDLADIAFDYLDREVLAKYHFADLPYPSLSLPSHNFDDPVYGTDVPTRPEHKMMEVLDEVFLGKRSQDLLTALESQHVLFIGGFGAGSDLLAKHLLLEVAKRKDDNGLLTLQYCGGFEGANRLLELAESDAMTYGTALIFRDLFDPQLSLWNQESGGYMEECGGLFTPQIKERRVAKALQGLPDASHLGRLISRFREAPKNSSYLVITTQFDSLRHLAKAIHVQSEFSWKKSVRQNLENLIISRLGDFFIKATDGITANHLDEMARSIMRRWTANGGVEPVWFRDREQLYQYADVADLYRPAVWCRMLWHLLLSTGPQMKLDSATVLARQIKLNAHNEWTRLHQRSESN